MSAGKTMFQWIKKIKLWWEFRKIKKEIHSLLNSLRSILRKGEGPFFKECHEKLSYKSESEYRITCSQDVTVMVLKPYVFIRSELKDDLALAWVDDKESFDRFMDNNVYDKVWMYNPKKHPFKNCEPKIYSFNINYIGLWDDGPWRSSLKPKFNSFKNEFKETKRIMEFEKQNKFLDNLE